MPADRISIDNAKIDKLFYFVANVLVYRDKEEAGIAVDKLEKFGIITFEFENNPEMPEVHMFCAKEFSGELIESEEMKPAWFDINNLPFDQMWPDDKFWMPLLLKGKKFRGKFLFDDYNKIIEHNLEIVKEI